MRRILLLAGSAALAALLAAPSWAGTLSSSKAAITQGDLIALGQKAAACDEVNIDPTECEGPGTSADSGWITVMRTYLRTPNDKDLHFDVSLQCALITFTKASGKNGGGKEGSNASGRIAVRVKVTEVDNNGDDVVGVDPRFADPTNDGTNVLGTDVGTLADPGGLTYCFRFQELALQFEDFLCTDFENGNDDCALSIELLLKTLTAHAFNFSMEDVSSGPKKIEVQARATADANVFCDNLPCTGQSAAKGEAFVGMGATVVETLRLVKSYDPADGPLFDWTDLE